MKKLLYAFTILILCTQGSMAQCDKSILGKKAKYLIFTRNVITKWFQYKPAKLKPNYKEFVIKLTSGGIYGFHLYVSQDKAPVELFLFDENKNELLQTVSKQDSSFYTQFIIPKDDAAIHSKYRCLKTGNYTVRVQFNKSKKKVCCLLGCTILGEVNESEITRWRMNKPEKDTLEFADYQIMEKITPRHVCYIVDGFTMKLTNGNNVEEYTSMSANITPEMRNAILRKKAEKIQYLKINIENIKATNMYNPIDHITGLEYGFTIKLN